MGKLSNKFFGAFGGSDDEYDEYDDDYDYDDYDEEYDDYEDEVEEERGGFFGKKKSQSEPVEDDREPRDNSKQYSFQKQQRSRQTNSRMNGNEVCIIKPSSIEDSREITETLLNGKAVVINFEGLHVEISQRIIDFISGSCYALDGNLQKISNYIFIASPNSVDISGDFQDIFGESSDNAFDIAGFKSPLL